jgi:fatty acid desaturase
LSKGYIAHRLFQSAKQVPEEKSLEAKKDTKWILIVSLIMFFYFAYTTPPTYWALSPSGVSTSRPDNWYYAGTAAVLFFLITILLATLHTAGFGKGTPLYQTTILFFIIAVLLSFVNKVGQLLRP